MSTLGFLSDKTIPSHRRFKIGKNSVPETIGRFHTHLIQHRLKRSKQRDLIWAAFATRDHVTAQNLYLLLARKGHRISLGTIYRTMNLLCDIGIAQARHFGPQTQYDHHTAHGHHDHLICSRCGHIEKFDNPEISRLRQEIATTNGFSLSIQKLELYGLCAICSSQPEFEPTRWG